MQNKSLKKRQGISLKRLKDSEITQQLTQNILQDNFKQSQKTSIKRVNNLQNNLSIKRANTTLRTRNRSNIEELGSRQNKNQLHHKTMPVKFTKLALNNPICSHHDQNIQKLVQEITPKSQCFYKFGFKSYEKPSHKRVFSDMMNLQKQETKGLLFIGELWNNQLTKTFMKANNVNLSKRKLFEKLRDMKWQKAKKQKEQMLDSRQLINSVRQLSQRSQKSINSFQQFQSMFSINNMTLDDFEQDNTKSQQSNEKISKTFRQSLENLRTSIDHQFKQNKNQQYWKMMKGLQKQSKQIHHLWDRYFIKMVQNQ